MTADGKEKRLKSLTLSLAVVHVLVSGEFDRRQTDLPYERGAIGPDRDGGGGAERKTVGGQQVPVGSPGDDLQVETEGGEESPEGGQRRSVSVERVDAGSTTGASEEGIKG